MEYLTYDSSDDERLGDDESLQEDESLQDAESVVDAHDPHDSDAHDPNDSESDPGDGGEFNGSTVQANINMIATEIMAGFKLNDSYSCHENLRAPLTLIATNFGFVIRRQGMSFVCNRNGPPVVNEKDNEDTTSRERKTWLRCNCPFKISFNFSEKPTAFERAEGQKGPKSQKIHITAVNPYHGNGCDPSPTQAVHCTRISGALINKNSESALMAVNLVNTTHVQAHVLRKMLEPSVPRNVELTSKDICNFRLWAKKNWSKIQNDQGVTLPLNDANVKTILAGGCVEYNNLSFTQPAMYESAAILNELLAANLDAEQGPHLLNYLELLKVKDRGFDYRVAKALDGKLVGVVWQTSSMRANFARYGDCLFLDFMKRKLNSINWPYIGPAVIDGYKKVRVVAEGIFVSERKSAYAFVLNALFDMSEGCRGKDEVYAVFADNFFSDDILEMAGIGDTCKYLWDQYQLSFQNFLQLLGKAYSF